MNRPAVRLALCVVVLLAAAAVAWAAPAWRSGGKPALAAALDAVPRSTLAFSFTDWRAVEDEFPGSGGDVGTAASTRDVTSRSVLASTADGLQKTFGWSVGDLVWEGYAQSSESSVVVVRLDDSLSVSTVTKGLRSAGYAQDGDTWTIDAAKLRSAEVSDLLATVHVHAREHVLVASDVASGVRQADRVLAGRARSLASDPPMARTAQALAGADAIFVQRGRLGCESTSVDDPEALPAATTAVQRAGGLTAYTASGRALTDHGGSGFGGQSLTFAMTFDDPSVARRQLDVRSALARGQFIGRTGQVADTLRLDDAATQGSTLTLEFRHDPDTDAFMSGAGAVLFATC